MTWPGTLSRWTAAALLLFVAGTSQPATAQVTGVQLEGIWFQHGVKGPGLVMILRTVPGKDGKPTNALRGRVGTAKRSYQLKGDIVKNDFVQLHRWIPLDELKKTSKEGKAQAWGLFGDVSRPKYKFLVAPVYFKFDAALRSLAGKITEIGVKYDKTYLFGTKQIDVRFGSKLGLPRKFKEYWADIHYIAELRPDFVRKFVERLSRARDDYAVSRVVEREINRANDLAKAAEAIGSTEQAVAYYRVAEAISNFSYQYGRDRELERQMKERE